MPPTRLTARMHAHIKPIVRGERYEDPPDDAPRQNNLGEIFGGGLLLSALAEIEFAEIEMDINDLDAAL
jgi:hypothetical protein